MQNLNSVKALGDHSIRIASTELTAYDRSGRKVARRYYANEGLAKAAYKGITTEKKLKAWVARNGAKTNPPKKNPAKGTRWRMDDGSIVTTEQLKRKFFGKLPSVLHRKMLGISKVKTTKKNPRNCSICGKPVHLSPSASERARRYGGKASDYEALFPTHSDCLIKKRDADVRALMRSKKNPMNPRISKKTPLYLITVTLKSGSGLANRNWSTRTTRGIIDARKTGASFLGIKDLNSMATKGKTAGGVDAIIKAVKVKEYKKNPKNNPKSKPKSNPSKKVTIPKSKRAGETFTKNGKKFTVISYLRAGKRIRFARKA